MAQLPISELSAAHNSKRWSACSFCLPSFFVMPDLLPHLPTQLIDSFCVRQAIDPRAVR
jgi:hypothetical protein